MAKFNGSDYIPALDDERLSKQISRVYSLMLDEHWRTLEEIAGATGDPPASISAQLRHLRKPRFGGHTIDKQSRGERADGLFEYRMIAKPCGLLAGERTLMSRRKCVGIYSEASGVGIYLPRADEEGAFQWAEWLARKLGQDVDSLEVDEFSVKVDAVREIKRKGRKGSDGPDH